jgi:hypothetical protein
VVDPRSNSVTHYQPGVSEVTHATPRTFDLACGCRVTVA